MTFSPKKEIINYFDSLINRVDIDIDECIQNFNEEQILNQLPCFEIENRKLKSLSDFSLEYFDSYKSNQNTYQIVNQSTKVIDYLNQIRKRTIDELTKAQQESLQYLRLNSSQLKTNENQITEYEFRSEIFKEKFYFQVLYKPVDPKYSVPWIFNLYTFVTDFYMSPTDINLLETLINSSSQEQDNEGNQIKQGSDFELILDEKMILIGLLQNCFFKNLQTQKFPSCVIDVSKHELLNIRRIFVRYQLIEVNLSASSNDLSNLEELIIKKVLEGETKESSEIKIEGLCSLKHLYLKCFSTAQISLNLNELREFDLHLIGSLNSDFQSKLFDYLPNVEILFLNAIYLSNFSLDRFINLKVLTIIGTIMDDFNFGLFDNLCNQLEEIGIVCPNMDDKYLDKLFGHSFPFLQNLIITESSITKLDNKLLKAFPRLQSLEIYKNIELRIIDDDAFSNSKHLVALNLKDNCIKSISKKHFSDLAKLKVINMSNNRLETIEENMFSSQRSLELVDLSNNQLSSLHPKSFADLRKLRYVDLGNNKLRHFNLDVTDNIREIQINLSGNPIINKKEIFNRFLKPQIKRYIYF